jgi:hypothetical protein
MTEEDEKKIRDLKRKKYKLDAEITEVKRLANEREIKEKYLNQFICTHHYFHMFVEGYRYDVLAEKFYLEGVAFVWHDLPLKNSAVQYTVKGPNLIHNISIEYKSAGTEVVKGRQLGEKLSAFDTVLRKNKELEKKFNIHKLSLKL